ncbi:MAG: tRNA preQ1(34) S-adenosylmethionine ribosyltransferase-isomerase QueA [Elusimicrobia bacterium]|nr:tRNA preQ1(34) S-adenosylmethionine ribosyltransferase-isomerase QueA [Elusimicrobiota bacterium]
MKLADFDFNYPEELVAAYPCEPRDSARLMVARRLNGPGEGGLEHRAFRDLPDLLDRGDCLVLNRTRVFPARLLGKKSTGGRADILLVREHEPGLWVVLSSGLKSGMRLHFPADLRATVEALDEDGQYLCRFDRPDVLDYAENHGMAPLPPYILRRRRLADAGGKDGRKQTSASEDNARYQTVYARQAGSIAAPTAGLHFTMDLFARLERKGIRTAWLTLHVGRGTFKPIEHEDPRHHRMLPEWYRMKDKDCQVIKSTMAEGRRVAAVGTTSTRVLETLARATEGIHSCEGWTDLYIHPGHEFKAVSALVTNFHLPCSTPLMLASAFLGRRRLLAAYREAVSRGYRLFSFGDAMLML